MPAAIPFIVAAVAEYGAAAGVGWFTATQAVAIQLAAAAGAAALSAQQASAARRRAASANARDLTLTLQSSAEPRRTVYGKAKVGGPLIYATTHMDVGHNKFLSRLVAVADHEIDGWEKFYFNDDELSLFGLPSSGEYYFSPTGGKYSEEGQPVAAIEAMSGTDSQAALANTIAASGGQWTADHRMRGVAYFRAQTNYTPNIYTEGLPNPSAVIRGKKLYDPRTGTTYWSRNPALVILDYLMSALDVQGTSIDDASFIAAANVCDEYVTIDTATTTNPTAWTAYLNAAVAEGVWELAGGTVYRQRRYTFDGVVLSDVNPGNILEQMVLTCAGYLSYTGGVYRLVAGSYTAPTFTITEKDLRGPVSVRPRPGRRERFNEARGTFVGPLTNYVATDFNPEKSPEFLADDNGFPSPMDLDLPFTNETVMAQRIARNILMKSRQGVVSVQCTLTALVLRPGDTVMLTVPALGFISSVFKVESWKFTEDFGIDLQLREEAAALYDWSPTTTAKDPSPNINLPNPWSVPEITGLVATSGVAQAIIQNDGTIVQRTRLAWDLANDAFARWIQIQSRVIGGTEITWTSYPDGIDEDGFAYLLNMRAGIPQEIRARRVNTVGAIGAWATIAYTPTDVNEVENLIQNSNWEDELGYHESANYPDARSLRAWSAASANGTWQVYGRNYDGGRTWNLGRGGSWMHNAQPTSGQYQYLYQWVRVVPGVEYEAQVRCLMQRCWGRVAVNFYTADRSTVTGSAQDGFDSGNTIDGDPYQFATHRKFWLKAVAPAGTVWALFFCIMQNTATTGTSPYSFWHQAMLNVAPPGVTRESATPWNRSGNDTVDGQRVLTITYNETAGGSSNIGTSGAPANWIMLASNPTYELQVDATFEANAYEFNPSVASPPSAPYMEMWISLTRQISSPPSATLLGASAYTWVWPHYPEYVPGQFYLAGMVPVSMTLSKNVLPGPGEIWIWINARAVGNPSSVVTSYRLSSSRWNVYIVRKVP